MVRQAAALAIPALLLVGAVAFAMARPSIAAPAASSSSSIGLIAVDADSSGNGPRGVGSTEGCASASVGQPLEIDVVIPHPGVPLDRGIAAFQFTLYYDPTVLWIEDDDLLLLAQAPGSNVLDISDPKPDRNGVYFSWGVDFGPAGVEPAGASETGPGVISRITLLPRSNGSSTLALQDVTMIDDASKEIAVDSVQSAKLYVGQPCPAQGNTATPTPSAAAATTAPSPPAAAASTPTPTPAPSGPAGFSASGGPPPSDDRIAFGLAAAGLGAALVGVSLTAGAGRMLERRSRKSAAVAAESRTSSGERVAGGNDSPSSSPMAGLTFPTE